MEHWIPFMDSRINYQSVQRNILPNIFYLKFKNRKILVCLLFINVIIIDSALPIKEAKKFSLVLANNASGSLLMQGAVWKRREMVCACNDRGIWYFLALTPHHLVARPAWLRMAGLISHSHVHYRVTGHQIVTSRHHHHSHLQ